jgi:hypothetical protein
MGMGMVVMVEVGTPGSSAEIERELGHVQAPSSVLWERKATGSVAWIGCFEVLSTYLDHG